jgi:hypothetical protein
VLSTASPRIDTRGNRWGCKARVRPRWAGCTVGPVAEGARLTARCDQLVAGRRCWIQSYPAPKAVSRHRRDHLRRIAARRRGPWSHVWSCRASIPGKSPSLRGTAGSGWTWPWPVCWREAAPRSRELARVGVSTPPGRGPRVQVLVDTVELGLTGVGGVELATTTKKVPMSASGALARSAGPVATVPARSGAHWWRSHRRGGDSGHCACQARAEGLPRTSGTGGVRFWGSPHRCP